MVYIFVYGTLKRGQVNHAVIAPYIVLLEPATISGSLFHLPQGYPMLLCSGMGTVIGELIGVTDEQAPKVLAVLDALEDYYGAGHPDNEYERIRVKVDQRTGESREAWSYCCPTEKTGALQSEARIVASGCWQSI